MQLARRLAFLFAILATLVAPVAANPMLLVDIDNLQVLYEQEAGQPWHPASLTKLMTAFVTFEAIANGRVSLDTKVVLSRKAVSQAPSTTGLPADSALSLQDALYILIVKSANDVAWAIAETVSGSEEKFVAEMNGAARRLGMTATHFENPNGLHDPKQVTTARDLAVLSLYIRQLYPQYLPIFQTERVTLGKASMETNNNLLSHFAGTTGMKTGYICASGLNIVATAERGGRRLMAVVLGGSSARERGEMTAQLFLRGFSGAVKAEGRRVLDLANAVDAAPVDMRPKLCGKEAKAYVKAREAEFPMGLDGQPSYLTDVVEGRTYAATNLGRLRDVPLPRIRPAHAPVASAVAVAATEPMPVSASVAPVATLTAKGAPVPRPRLVR